MQLNKRRLVGYTKLFSTHILWLDATLTSNRKVTAKSTEIGSKSLQFWVENLNVGELLACFFTSNVVIECLGAGYSISNFFVKTNTCMTLRSLFLTGEIAL